MRTVVSFFILVFLILALSPLLAYPIHLVVENFVDFSFHKLVKYTTLVCGLIFSGLYLKYNQIYSRESFGFGVQKQVFLKDLFRGLLAGLVLLGLLKIFLLLFGVHQIRPNLEYFWSNLLLIFIKGILTGLAVGLIEESIFRGALFSSLYKKTSAVVAVSLTSLLYAAVHFLKYREMPEGTEITWNIALEILPNALFRFSDPNIIDYFLTLLVLGILLSMIRLRKGNIAMCIGVHAGIVMAMKVTGRITEYVPDNNFNFLVSKYEHTLGYLSLFWLLVLAIVYWRKYLYVKQV